MKAGDVLDDDSCWSVYSVTGEHVAEERERFEAHQSVPSDPELILGRRGPYAATMIDLGDKVWLAVADGGQLSVVDTDHGDEPFE